MRVKSSPRRSPTSLGPRSSRSPTRSCSTRSDSTRSSRSGSTRSTRSTRSDSRTSRTSRSRSTRSPPPARSPTPDAAQLPPFLPHPQPQLPAPLPLFLPQPQPQPRPQPPPLPPLLALPQLAPLLQPRPLPGEGGGSAEARDSLRKELVSRLGQCGAFDDVACRFLLWCWDAESRMQSLLAQLLAMEHEALPPETRKRLVSYAMLVMMAF